MPNNKDLICKIHGLCKHTKRNRKGESYRCNKCASAYIVKLRQNRKLRLIELLGGKCSKCGYNKCPAALDFHHLDRSTKEFEIGGSGAVYSWERTLKEVKKCILVCKNCHTEIEMGL